jgi:hypothetical protein
LDHDVLSGICHRKLVLYIVGVLYLACSADHSLGGGRPAQDASPAVDTAVADVLGEDARTGLSCTSRPVGDAGGGLTNGLVAFYRCESAGGASANLLLDSTSHGNDGVLMTGTGGSGGYSFGTGRAGNGNALDLTYAKQGYVTLPPGLLAEACDFTIATWVYLNSNTNAFSRIWDFGQDATTYMFLTPITNVDNFARFAISVSGNLHEQGIKAQMAVPTLQWTHVALVVGASGATLYFNGSPVGSDTTMTLRPVDLGRTANDYIGRSQFSSDPYLDGKIDEFRIYDRALSVEEIQALASGS